MSRFVRVIIAVACGFAAFYATDRANSLQRQVVVKVTGFDQFEVSGRYRHTHRRVLTDAGPFRLPNDREFGSYDDRVAMRTALTTGCRYELLISHEPKDHQASAGNYRFIFRGNRELDVGRIDKVVRSVNCG
jgi:hypothetical protein